jgi:hypothetical protein
MLNKHSVVFSLILQPEEENSYIDRDLLLPLWHQTPKIEEGKAKSSLRFFFDLIVIIIISVGVVVPSPWVLHSWRRRRWVDDVLRGLKTHRSAHLTLTLL